jgi:hypothetical protein
MSYNQDTVMLLILGQFGGLPRGKLSLVRLGFGMNRSA